MTARTAPRWGTIACVTVAITATGILIAGDPARATEPTPTVEVFWSMPDGGTPEHVTYPQTYSPDGAVAAGVCYQIDTYSPTDAALFTADNTLTEGEDYADVNGPGTGVISWRFVCVPAVEVVIPPAPTETPAPVETPPAEVPAPTPVTPRTDAVVEQVAAKTAAPVLAATGFDNPWLFRSALALIVGGIFLIRAPFRAVQKKRESK
jgi:hypothetical protein